MEKLENLILKTYVETIDKRRATTITPDKVFIPAVSPFEDFTKINKMHMISQPSDYAIINGITFCKKQCMCKRNNACAFLRSNSQDNTKTDYIDENGEVSFCDVNRQDLGFNPQMNLDINKVVDNIKALKLETKTINQCGCKYHTIELGQYPQTIVSDELAFKLEREYFRDLEAKLFSKKIGAKNCNFENSSKLTKTGQIWDGYTRENGEKTQNFEYEFEGKRYVRAEVNNKIQKNKFEKIYFSNFTPFEKERSHYWVKVESIKWAILNWKDLPSAINPEGSSSAQEMLIQTENTLLSGMPFTFDKTKGARWPNSDLRKYLNENFIRKIFDSTQSKTAINERNKIDNKANICEKKL